MNREKNQEKLTKIFRDILRNPDLVLRGEMAQGSLPGWDSMNHMQILLALEPNFGFALQMDEALALKSVDDILLLLDKNARVP